MKQNGTPRPIRSAGRMILLLWLLCHSSVLPAQDRLDHIEASLITCSPGTELYSLYGHTALRVQNHTRGMDYVFNYGVFDFRTPHFAWRFVLGQTDYMVEGIPFPYFLREYQSRGSEVVEQTLDLTPREANRLFLLLLENLRPENRVYRYNFLTNNCTTKVRDILVQALDGTLVYAPSEERFTSRQLLHQCTAEHPWVEVGNDLLLGATCDTLLAVSATHFLPALLEAAWDGVQVFDTLGNRRPLVRQKRVLSPEAPPPASSSFPLAPWAVGVLFVGLNLLVFVAERKTKRMFWGVDLLLMLVQGLTGTLVAFMFFFSQHPTVDANWQLWVLNPLPLLALPWVVARARKRQFCVYHPLNLAGLTLFIVLSPWLPQDFSEIIVPLTFGLLVRPVSYCMYYTRK